MKPDSTSENRILSSKIRNHWNAVFLAVLVAFMGFPPLPGGADTALPAAAEAALLITPETLRSMPRKETVLVDTRSFFKYLVGHIPGAVRLGGWETFTRKVGGVRGLLIEDRRFIAERLKAFGIGRGTTIVVYSEPKDPWRTDGRFFWMFERYGFNRVAILEGGLARWKETGGAIERGRGDTPTPSSLATDDIRFNDAVAADQAWIAERLGSSGLAIVDNRTRKEFDGATPYGSARGGHIPNAVHIHWPDFFTPKGLMKNKDALTQMMKRYGIRPDQEVVVYCTGGVRSGMAYFVFRFLGYKVRNYDGSWWDWSLNLNLPVENS